MPSALACVQINVNGTINDFRLAVALLLSMDPYDKHRSANNRCKYQILVINLKVIGHIKATFDLIWHTKSEYSHLNKEQHKEIYEQK